MILKIFMPTKALKPKQKSKRINFHLEQLPQHRCFIVKFLLLSILIGLKNIKWVIQQKYQTNKVKKMRQSNQKHSLKSYQNRIKNQIRWQTKPSHLYKQKSPIMSNKQSKEAMKLISYSFCCNENYRKKKLWQHLNSSTPILQKIISHSTILLNHKSYPKAVQPIQLPIIIERLIQSNHIIIGSIAHIQLIYLINPHSQIIVQQMGQNQSEYILISDLDKINIRDSPPIKYLWFDIKINNEENTEYFEMFIKHFQIYKFWDFEMIKEYISSQITNDWDLRLICSASLSHQQYEVFQKHYKIKKILLFCSNPIRANFLKSNYSKITTVAFNPFQVIDCTRIWQLQKDTNLYFYGIDHIKQLNNFLFKWKGFVSDVDRQIGKKNFIAFAKACCKNENIAILEYQKYYDLKVEKDVKDKMIAKWIFRSSFFFTLTAQTLKLSNNHQKLPYVRQPIFDIFSFIKANYSRSNYKSKKYYAKIFFSETELAILNQNKPKICYFSTFIKASCSRQSIILLQRQSLIMIQVPQKNMNYQCNGYYEYEQSQVVFNLGNIFKYQKSADNLFIFELIPLPKSNKNLNQNTRRILSHQFYINNMLKYLPHQCMNFLLNDQPILACQYFMPKTKNIKTVEEHVKIKYSLVKIKIWQNKYHLCIYPFLESFKHLLYSKSQIVDDLHSICKMTKIAQMKWMIKYQLLLVHFNHKQYNCCQKIIVDLKSEYQTKKNYDYQFIQVLLIEIFCEANNDFTSRSQLKKLLDQLTTLEHQYFIEQKREIDLLTYTLFLRCKIFIFVHLRQFQIALKLIDQCLDMIGDCDGRNQFFNLFSQIKLQILQNLHIETIKRQYQIKKIKCRSNISMNEFQNQAFHFKLNGLDFCFFD